MNKKGQIFSIDFLLAIGVFLIILIASFSVWNTYQERSQEIENIASMTLKAQVATQSLLLTPGEPINWYEYNLSENISSIGLLTGNLYNLDPKKLNGLEQANFSYVNISKVLGVVGYELYIILENESGVLYKFGAKPNLNAEHVISVQRLAQMEGKPVQLKVKVWQ